MLLDDKQVAVIGGGPGGLTLGRLLQQRGVQVKVYERDADQYVRQQGSTLDLHEDTGLRAMRAADLMDEFRSRYRPGADRSVVLDSHMNVILDEHTEEKEQAFGDALFRPEIDRGPLRDMLVSSLKPENIVWNARCTGLTPAGSGWDMHFEDGTVAYADLVIAADGASSRLRKYITDIQPVYSGVTAIEGTIPDADRNAPNLWRLAKGGSMFALEGGKTIMFITRGDNTLTFLVGMKLPETWRFDSGINLNERASVRAWFRTEFASWSPAWDELFASKALTMEPRPWYYFPVDQSWTPLSNLCMIGDAAHRMPAYAGEGANQALADAVDLYEALCCEGHESTGAAIASYETTMRRRSALATAESLRNTEAFHAPDAMRFLLDLFGGGC